MDPELRARLLRIEKTLASIQSQVGWLLTIVGGLVGTLIYYYHSR